MKIIDFTNIMAIVDEEQVKKVFKEKFDKIKQVDNWAIHGFPGEHNESDLWPVIDGRVLEWSYPYQYAISVIRLLDTMDREYSLFVYPEHHMPLIIKIKMLYQDTKQGYFLISPQTQSITEDL